MAKARICLPYVLASSDVRFTLFGLLILITCLCGIGTLARLSCWPGSLVSNTSGSSSQYAPHILPAGIGRRIDFVLTPI